MPTYLTEATGWIACVLEVYAFQEKTMIPLRVAAVFACLFGFAYGYLTHAYPSMAVSVALLPLHLSRLKELRRRTARRGHGATPSLIGAGTTPRGAQPSVARLRPVI